jgi:flagellar motor switch protein FliN/FliY
MAAGDPGDPNAPAAGVSLEEMAPPSRETEAVVGDKTAADLEAVFDVPVRVSVVLGRARVPVANLLKMDVGTVVELDRQVGEAVEIYVNERLVARGEIVLVESRLGVTMTEIVKAA